MPDPRAATAPESTTPWYREITAPCWRALTFAGLGWMFDVYDTFVLSLTIPALVAAFALTNAQAGSIGSILAGGLIVGGILMGGLNDGGWRVVYGLGCLPALILLPVALKTPESPVWLARAQAGDKGAPLTELLRPEVLRGIAMAFVFIFFVQYVYWGVLTWTPAYLVNVKHLAFIRGLGFVMTQQAGSLCGFLTFAALADRIGRKPTFVLYLVTGALAVGSLVTWSAEPILLVTMFATGFGIAGIFAGMGPFTAEMVANTSARGLAMGIAYNGGRLGGLIAPVLIGSLATTESGFTVGMATTIVAFLLAIVVILLCPETKGRSIR